MKTVSNRAAYCRKSPRFALTDGVQITCAYGRTVLRDFSSVGLRLSQPRGRAFLPGERTSFVILLHEPGTGRPVVVTRAAGTCRWATDLEAGFRLETDPSQQRYIDRFVALLIPRRVARVLNRANE